MAGSKKREAKIFTFYMNEEEGERYFAPCYVRDTAGDNEENRELMFDLDDIHEIEEAELPSLICKIRKSLRNKKRVLEGFQICYPNEGPSRSKGEPMMQEEAAKERLVISICERYDIQEENHPVIKTLTYSDKYGKLPDEICLDKKLDEAMKDEQKEAIKRVKGEELIEKEDTCAFIFMIRIY
nr:hypothetical protein [Tanacetum cinerariifolium]